MAAFLLETGAVESASSTLSSLASQVASIASAVNGYDVSCEDFNFAGAKASIAANIQALEEKIKNAATIVDTVVAQHTQLQNSLTFDGSATTTDTGTQTDISSSPSTTSGTSYPSGTSTSSGQSYSSSGPSYSSSGPSYSSSSPSSSSSDTIPTPSQTDPVTTTQPTIIATDITQKIDKIDHAQIDTSQNSNMLSQITYNEAGYAMINGMFVIVCAEAFGKVGEQLEIALNDGTKVNCVIGANNNDLGGQITFVTNDKWSAEGTGNISPSLPEKVEKVTNYRQETTTTTAATSTTQTSTTSTAPANTTSTAPADTTSTVAVTQPATLGTSTHSWDTLSDSWTIVSTKASVESYSKAIEGKVSQNADSTKYGDKCLSFAETHAYALYTGNTNDSAASAADYPHGGAFTSWYSDSKQETLQKIYEQVSQGKPVVIQVNGNKAGTSRHFVTVVGFRNSVNDTNQLSEKDLLIIDSWDGKVERMDQNNSRFLTSGKDCGKSYSGYYLRVLKS